MFHGFGLAAGIHAMLISGGTCILVPRFSADAPGRARAASTSPPIMAGVPTLFDALAANPQFQQTASASFKGLFCGGDSLSRQTKQRFEAVLPAWAGHTPLREGYGLTESVTANIADAARTTTGKGAWASPIPT